MKRTGLLMVLLCIGAFSLNTAAYAWNWGAHAYIDDHIGKKCFPLNANEIYGGMAPDAFIFMFDRPDLSNFLYARTHFDAVQMWDAARGVAEKAYAFGFVSHNNAWGADYTAHTAGLTFGLDKGYVIAKALILKNAITPVLSGSGLTLPDEVLMVICHNFVEYGTDVLVKKMDPQIGRKIMTAALLRSPEFPALYARAYSDDLAGFAGISKREAAGIIKEKEREFRKDMMLYGQALAQDDATTIELFAEELNSVAAAYLASNGITLPPGTDLLPLIKYGIAASIELCKVDFPGELTATVDFVNTQMAANAIHY